MKLALLADPHANLQALQACVAHARAQGAESFAVLGDLVGYGGQPAEVVDLVRELAAGGAIVVRGNHDEAALNPRVPAQTELDASAHWSSRSLDEEQKAFLAGLPLTALLDGSLIVHASAAAPAQWHYVDHPVQAQQCLDAAALLGASRVFCGHVHHQRLFYRGRGRGLLAFEPTPGAATPLPAHRAWVATVGSVGQPRDGDVRAMYAVFDAQRAQLVFHRVAYDHLAAAAAVRSAGLPAPFAQRLQEGR